MSAHATMGLYYCPECADAARRILVDIEAMESPRAMTEPELRRAAGDADFCSLPADVKIARSMLSASGPLYAGPYILDIIAAQVRAIVQQALVDRIVAWCEDVVTP